MDRKHNSKIVPFAKELRKNMTKEERHLWYDFLKTYPVRFLRQKVFEKEKIFINTHIHYDDLCEKAE